MRACLVVVIAACSSPHAREIVVVPVAPPAPCDAQRWHEAEVAPHRAWLVSAQTSFRHREQRPVDRSAQLAAAPLTVLDVDDEDALLADIRPGAIVARWSPRTALGRAVVHESLVSATRGGPGDPAVRVTPGYRVASGSESWLAIAPADGVSISGWVPRTVSGAIWEVHDPARPTIHHDALTIFRDPYVGAAVVAGIEATTPYRIDRVRILDDGWFEVTIVTPFATIQGYVHPPPPRPGDAGNELELADAAAYEPYPVGTCLRDAPNGNVVGMVRGPLDITPVREVDRWHAVVLPTVWGDVTLYVDGEPAAPPADVPWDDAWRGWDAD